MVQKCKALYLALVCLLLVACSGGDYRVDYNSPAWRTYPDSVVSLNDVDPAYRSYFRAQHGSNYSKRDQIEAFRAAARTARTPVPKSAPWPKTEPRPKRTASRGKAKPAARKGKAAPKKRANTANNKKKPTRKSTRRRS